MKNKPQEEILLDFVRRGEFKYVDLSKSKEEICDQFFGLIDGGAIDTNKDLEMLVLKSYLFCEDEEVMEDADAILKDSNMTTSKDVHMLVEHFLNKYIFEKPTVWENPYYIDSVVKFYFDKLEEIMGDYVYYNAWSVSNFNFRKIGTKEMANHGYVATLPNRIFLTKKEPTNKETQSNPRYQSFLLRTYRRLIKNYTDLKMHKKGVKYEKETESMILNFMQRIENRLSNESKQSPTYVQSKRFIDQSMQSNHYASYYETMLKAFLNFSKNQQTEEDVANIEDFRERLALLGKYLPLQDEKGQNHYTNYFKIMPISTAQYRYLLLKFSSSCSLTEQEKKDLFTVRDIFLHKFHVSNVLNDRVGDTLQVLRELPIAVQTKDFAIDLSNEKDYVLFCKKVDEYVENNNLPKFRECVTSVAKSMTKGIEPLYLPEFKENKQKECIEKCI